MPLKPYRRNGKWWAKGRVEFNGRPISEYCRCTTGANTEQAAWEWCLAEEDRQRRIHLLGPELAEKEPELTFVMAVTLYEANTKTAKYLIPIVEQLGETLVADITPKMIRDLGKELYPDAGTATWTRQVISPVRSVINNAHDLGKCPPIKIKGYDRIEKTRQDKRRGSSGRRKQSPGSWEWLLAFREHAERRVRALAMTMFLTGARISQAIEMRPEHLDLDNNRICIPGAKGMEDRWVTVIDLLVEDLRALPPELYPRGWAHIPDNRRVFGYADRSSPRKHWDAAIKKAGIEHLSFHNAGRHGFGQEMNVRTPIDEKAASAFGGWSDVSLMKRTYTHAEQVSAKVHEAQKAGLERAKARRKTSS